MPEHTTGALVVIVLGCKLVDTPRIGNGNVAIAFAGLGRATKAGGTEVETFDEALHIGGSSEGLQVFLFFAIDGEIAETEAVTLPTMALVSEVDTCEHWGLAGNDTAAEFVEIASPYSRTGDAITNDIDSQEIGVGAHEVSLQTCYLTGGTGIEHLTTLLQEELGLLEGVAYPTLYILAATEGGQSLLGLGIGMHGFEVIVPTYTKDDSTCIDRLLGQQGENASGTALATDMVVGVSGGIHLKGEAVVGLIEHRAHSLAKTTVNAVRDIYLRIKEALRIFI